MGRRCSSSSIELPSRHFIALFEYSQSRQHQRGASDSISRIDAAHFDDHFLVGWFRMIVSWFAEFFSPAICLECYFEMRVLDQLLRWFFVAYHSASEEFRMLSNDRTKIVYLEYKGFCVFWISEKPSTVTDDPIQTWSATWTCPQKSRSEVGRKMTYKKGIDITLLSNKDYKNRKMFTWR